MSEFYSAMIGLIMGQYWLQSLRQERKVVAVCLKCSATNPIQYKFCRNCGEAITNRRL